MAAGAMFERSAGAIAIRNARVIPVSAPVIPVSGRCVMPRADIILRNGLIEAVGADVTVPADAWVIEGDGLTVYPGLIDALSTFGIPDAAPAANTGGGRGGADQRPSPLRAARRPLTPPARGPEDRPTPPVGCGPPIWCSPPTAGSNRFARKDSPPPSRFPPRGIFAGQGAIVNLAGEKTGDMVVGTMPANT